MNERIKLLAEQAGDSISEFHFGDYNIPNEFIEKFAQLIVNECADLVQDDDNAFDILKHFGVE